MLYSVSNALPHAGPVYTPVNSTEQRTLATSDNSALLCKETSATLQASKVEHRCACIPQTGLSVAQAPPTGACGAPNRPAVAVLYLGNQLWLYSQARVAPSAGTDLPLVCHGKLRQAGAVVEVPELDGPVFQGGDQPPLWRVKDHGCDFHGLPLRGGELHELLSSHDVPDADGPAVGAADRLQ